MRKIGINLYAIAGLTEEEYIREAASLGFNTAFSGVRAPELQAKIGDLLVKYGMEYENLHAPFGHINDIWLEDDNGMLNELLNCIDNCVLCGAPIAVVHLSAGNRAPSITDIGRERFARLVDYAAEKNVKIAFENQRKLANIAWAFEAFPGDNVGFCWDCGHEFCFTPGRHYMPLFGNRLICTHIHDNTAVYNEDSHFLPFDGVCDFDYVADAIRTSGYTGSLMLEVGNKTRYGEMDPREFIREGYNRITKLRAMVDGE